MTDETTEPEAQGQPPLATAKLRARAGVLERLLGALRGMLMRLLGRDRFTAVLVLAAIAIVVLFFRTLDSTQPRSAGREVALTAITKLAADGQVNRATLLDEDARVVVRTLAGETLWAAYPGSDVATEAIRRELSKAGATVRIDQQSGKPTQRIVVQFLLPILLLVCLFALLTRIGQSDGSSGFAAFSKFGGQGRKRKRRRGDGHITFDQVAGVGEVVAELREVRDYLADPTRYARMGARAPKGVLLVGPPGTGKTLLARATAGEADASFFSLSGSDFVESLVGVGAARVRDLFAKARKMSPAIIFIDELDAAGRKRGAGVGQGNDEREQTLNQLLVEMDGFDGDAGIIVMAATNRPDVLDPALLRPGRFDRQITVDVPDVFGRTAILQLYLKGRPLEPDVDILEVAKLCPGFSGAELANVVNEAALLAVRSDELTISRASLDEAIERVVAGPAKRSHVMTDDERWVVAVHEASHAVVSRAIGQSVSTQKLSIVARGRQLGVAAHMLTDRDMVLMQEDDLRRQLCTMLAGAVAELKAFQQLSSGVNDDLHAATQVARQMVTSFGMSRLGLMSVGEASDDVFLGAALQELNSISETTLATVDAEVQRTLAEAGDATRHVLDCNWAPVVETATALLEYETLSGVALDALLSPVVAVTLDEVYTEHSDGRGARS